jgi:hypothetical protein
MFANNGLIEQNASRCAEAEPVGAIYREARLLNKQAARVSGMHRI